jgi:hypothetical protein
VKEGHKHVIEDLRDPRLATEVETVSIRPKVLLANRNCNRNRNRDRDSCDRNGGRSRNTFGHLPGHSPSALP